MRKLAFALLLAASASALAQAPFCAQLQTLIQGSPAHWGVSVTTLDGQSLCQINAAQLFRPASNAKLFTTAAALALLGAEKTFETKLSGDLDRETGTIRGDLTLIGAGDANLDSGDLPYLRTDTPRPPLRFHDLEALADQLVAKGVKRVSGDIVGDDTVFAWQPYPAAWELDDLMYGFAAPVAALSIADNQLHLMVVPGTQPGSPAMVTLDQGGVSYYTVFSEITTAPAKAPDSGYSIERSAGSRELHLTGSIPVGGHAASEEIAIDDPAAFAAAALRTALIARDIRVTGTTRATHRVPEAGAGFRTQLRAPDRGEASVAAGAKFEIACEGPAYAATLATHASAYPAEDILFTNKTSQNLHAEILLRQLGSLARCRDGSLVSGARMVRAFLVHAGISPDDVTLYDGSGLSSHDLVTPRSITQLLTYAARQAWFPAYKMSLPVGGVDGTLAKRFGGPLKGKVFAKTGTLGESRALSGFVTTATGQTLVFSVLDDNHPPDSSTDRSLMDRLVEQMATSN